MVTFAQYFHGVQLREDSDITTLPIEAQTSIIGLIGTSKVGPRKQLVLIDSPKKALELFGSNKEFDDQIELLKQRKATINDRVAFLEKAVNSIDAKVIALDNSITQLTTLLATTEDEKKPEVQKQIDDAADEKTKLAGEKTKNQTERTSLVKERDGEEATKVESIDERIKTISDQKVLSSLPDAFTAIYSQASPLIIAYNVYDDSKTSVSDYDAIVAGTEADGSGVYAFLDASDAFGFSPKLLVAPFHSSNQSVRTSLDAVAKKLRAVAFIDIDETKDTQAAIDEVKDLTSSRLQACYPKVSITNLSSPVPLSLVAAGHTARIDREQGFWVSPSNKTLNAISGVNSTKPVRFSLDDETSDVNRLNEAGITTVIRLRGFRYFGARTLGKTNEIDVANRFFNVRRTSDVINDTLVSIAFEAIDQNIGKNFLDAVVEDMNKYLAEKRREGAIINGTCTAPLSDNPTVNLTRGIVTFRVDYTPSFPAEQIRIISTITDKYIQEVFQA